MQEKVQEVQNDNSKIYLLAVEYDHLYTLGTSADSSHLLNIGNIAHYISERGGQVTYHGPGQRIIYPIIHLDRFHKDIRKYVTFLAEAVVNTLALYGVQARFCQKNIGVWVNRDNLDYKIASIGVRIKKWVSYHGIAINICPDLAKFDNIIACGLKNGRHISLQSCGVNTTLSEFDRYFCKTIYSMLDYIS